MSPRVWLSLPNVSALPQRAQFPRAYRRTQGKQRGQERSLERFRGVLGVSYSWRILHVPRSRTISGKLQSMCVTPRGSYLGGVLEILQHFNGTRDVGLILYKVG